MNRNIQLEQLYSRRSVEVRNGRLIIPVPNASKCDYGKCIMCGFVRNAGAQIGGLSQAEQIKLVKKYIRTAKRILKEQRPKSAALYCSGSFFNNKEVYEPVIELLFQFLRDATCIQEVVIESLPYFINEDRVNLLSSKLPDKLVLIGLGMECLDEKTRRDTINKNISTAEYEKAINVIKKGKNTLPKLFVLLGLPHSTAQESIKCAYETITWAIDKGIASVEIQPTNVMNGTILETYYRQGQFTLPTMEMIRELLKQIKDYILNINKICTNILVATDITPKPMVENAFLKDELQQFTTNAQALWEKTVFEYSGREPNWVTYRTELLRILETFIKNTSK